MRIPMCEPDITAAEREAVDEVLRGTTLSIGPRLELFERRVAPHRRPPAAGRRGHRAGRAAPLPPAGGPGEGGMVVTNHHGWDALFRSLRNQGRDVFDGWLAHSRLGYNYRLDELSAALGAVQAERLDGLLEKRARVAAWYEERLAALEGVERPGPAAWTTRMSWFVYVVRLAPQHDRGRPVRALRARGVPARPHLPPLPLPPLYRRRAGPRPGG